MPDNSVKLPRADAASKVFVLWVFLVRHFPHSNWIRRFNSLYSVQMWENTDQKYSVYGHFSSNNVACVIVESYRYSIISLLKFYWNDFPICQLLFSTSNYQVAIFSRASTHRKPFLDRQHESKSSLLLSCQITVGVL